MNALLIAEKYCFCESPVGRLLLSSRGEALCGVEFAVSAPPCGTEEKTPLLAEAIKQLEEYFAGERRVFSLPIEMRGSAFQQKVWRELQRIPYGETVSYGELARRIGEPGAARAVGGANHRNPIAIIVPCHRVINADGSLGGYGGGTDIKKFLLERERVLFFAE